MTYTWTSLRNTKTPTHPFGKPFGPANTSPTQICSPLNRKQCRRPMSPKRLVPAFVFLFLSCCWFSFLLLLCLTVLIVYLLAQKSNAAFAHRKAMCATEIGDLIRFALSCRFASLRCNRFPEDKYRSPWSTRSDTWPLGWLGARHADFCGHGAHSANAQRFDIVSEKHSSVDRRTMGG